MKQYKKRKTENHTLYFGKEKTSPRRWQRQTRAHAQIKDQRRWTLLNAVIKRRKEMRNRDKKETKQNQKNNKNNKCWKTIKTTYAYILHLSLCAVVVVAGVPNFYFFLFSSSSYYFNMYRSVHTKCVNDMFCVLYLLVYFIVFSFFRFVCLVLSFEFRLSSNISLYSLVLLLFLLFF